MRLTLLKAPLWPDPGADRGFHQFRYGILPHAGNWRQGRTPQQAIAFGQPMTVAIDKATNIPVGAHSRAPSPAIVPSPTHHSFLTLGRDVGLAAFKQAEDSTGDRAGDWILRCWDMYGQGGDISIQTPLEMKSCIAVNLLEEAIADDNGGVLRPWEIATFRLSFQTDNL
ncbi:MAG: hypothetical protein HC812_12065 [Leptolyngbya sp. RL_3_1]|nr:hypothetical protein [Leptolyngbya sp. RL_3_1]